MLHLISTLGGRASEEMHHKRVNRYLASKKSCLRTGWTLNTRTKNRTGCSLMVIRGVEMAIVPIIDILSVDGAFAAVTRDIWPPSWSGDGELESSMN